MLDKLQRQLEQIYEVDTSLQVSHFLITDPSLAEYYDTSDNARPTHEKLLVAPTDDGLDVALYLHHSIVQHLEAHDPTESLHEGNLHEFWVALEGISHFIYLTWNALHHREISLFELELQAEVDKFITAILLFDQPQDLHHARQILTKLFIKLQFDSALRREELTRYAMANHYAYRYCQKLMELFVEQRNEQRLYNEIRRFYRLTHHYKLKHICQA